MKDQLVEYYRRRVLRFEMDEDVADMQIVAYLQRGSAIRSSRTLADIPRPKPIKHSSIIPAIPHRARAAGE